MSWRDFPARSHDGNEGELLCSTAGTTIGHSFAFPRRYSHSNQGTASASPVIPLSTHPVTPGKLRGRKRGKKGSLECHRGRGGKKVTHRLVEIP